MAKKRISELQKYILFIIGRAFMQQERILYEVEQRHKKEGVNLTGSLKEIKIPEEIERKVLSELTELTPNDEMELSLLDFYEMIIRAKNYKNENSAKASISRSLKGLHKSRYILVKKVGGQIKLSLEDEGLHQYRLLKKKLTPFFKLNDSLKLRFDNYYDY